MARRLDDMPVTRKLEGFLLRERKEVTRMELYFLGTGAGMPSPQRNVTSIALRLFAERGTFWLFDCGEGTQHQILKSPLKLRKLENIFITHLHGDHLFGLPGLLSSRAYQGGQDPLAVYGPPGIRDWLETTLHLSQSRLHYQLTIHEIAEGTVFEDDRMTVETAKLDHRIDSYGYRIAEKERPGKLKAEELRRRGLRPGPHYGALKRGEDVTLPDGTTVTAAEVTSGPQQGATVVILGDTRPCEGASKLARQADMLVHEATYSHDLSDLAHEYYHSTSAQAAQTALAAGARGLIVTHFSSRYKDIEALQPLLGEAKAIFPNTMLAEEHVLYPVSARTGRASGHT